MASFTNEQVITAIDSAPARVQSVLRSADTAKVISAIGAAHKLHIDQIGQLAQINRNLLIGLVDPSEMYGELVGIGVTPEEAKLIMGEINQKIFVPLREAMRAGSAPTETGSEQPVLPKQQSATPTAVPYNFDTAAAMQTAVPRPSIQAPPPTQVFTPATGWPGAPAGNWQPAAAVHVYVPGPAPMHQQPSPYTVVHPEQQTYAPTPIATIPPAQPVFNSPQPEPTVRTVRPVPAPPANLPGAPVEKPIEKAYVADPYREQM